MRIGKLKNVLPDLLGIISLALGITVICGWYLRLLILIQLHQNFAPMQFNTALCFALSGLSLIFLSREKIVISRTFSSLLFILSSLSLSEYIFQWNLHIDELFVNAFVSTADQYPGRMAPNTALGFTLFACSSFFITLNMAKGWVIIHLGLIFLIISLAILSILGYFSNFTTHHGFGQWIRMALHTAIGFLIICIGFITYLHKRYMLVNLPAVPMLVSFILLNMSFLSWQLLRQNQENHLNALLISKIKNIRTLFYTYFGERATAFSRISYRWLSQEKGTPKSVWEADVGHYIEDQPGYVAIEWVDSNYKVRWVVPKKGNEQVVGFNLYQDAHRRKEIEKTLKEKKLRLSSQLNLIQGGKGILFFSPLLAQNRFSGFMVGVMNTQRLFNSLVNKMDLQGFNIAIYDHSERLYTNFHSDDARYKVWEKKLLMKMYGQNWEISMMPNHKLYNEIMSPVQPTIVLFIGIIISLLSGFLTESFLSIKKLQSKARNANERLQGIIEGSTDYIAAIDLNYNFIVFNSTYRNEVSRLFQIDLKLGMNFSVLFERMTLENQTKVKKYWERAMTGKSFTIIGSFNDKIHQDLAYEIHYNPIHDERGKLIGASHIATNIYQRLKSEKELVAYKQQLESVVTNLENQNRDLQLLKELSSMLQTNNSLDQALHTIDIYMKKLLSNTPGILYLISEQDENSLKAVLNWGDISMIREEANIDSCFGILRYQPYFVSDTEEDIVCEHINANSTKPKSYACLPLFTHKKLIGLFYIELNVQSSDLKTRLDLAQIIAEQISLSIYNIELQQSLKSQSIEDSLTGLYNRRFFDRYLHKEIAKSQRYLTTFAILLLDIDHFKKINDTYGHLVGDKTLQELAILLRQKIRDSDCIARWGGEEFIILLREINLDKVLSKAEDIRQSVAQINVNVQNEKLFFTVSIGIAMFNLGMDEDSLIKKADDALYQAKRHGRNQIEVSEDKKQNK